MTKINELKQAVDFLEKKHTDFEEKLDQTLALQVKMDKDFAVHQQYTKTTLDQILDQTRKTNGKVAENSQGIVRLDQETSNLRTASSENHSLADEAMKAANGLLNWKSKILGAWTAIAIISTLLGTIIGFVISILLK